MIAETPCPSPVLASLGEVDLELFARVFLACTKVSAGHYVRVSYAKRQPPPRRWKAEVQIQPPAIPTDYGSKAVRTKRTREWHRVAVRTCWGASPLEALEQARVQLKARMVATALDAIDRQRFALLVLACLDMSADHMVFLRLAKKGHGKERKMVVWKVDVQFRWGQGHGWHIETTSSQVSPFEAFERARQWLATAHAAVHVL